MQVKNDVFRSTEPFQLESGIWIPQLKLAYTILGNFSKYRRVYWFCHGITGNQHPEDWWNGQVGEGKTFDPSEDCLIAVNIPGSCYGSTGPQELKPQLPEPWLDQFPNWTVKDVAKSFQLLFQSLRLTHIDGLLGVSVGGMVALQWAVDSREQFKSLLLIATNAEQSAWAKGLNTAQRMAIEADASFYNKQASGGQKGLAAARAIAMLSYRTPESFEAKQHDFNAIGINQSRMESYLRYQGQKIVNRFSVHSYYALTILMDSHHIGDEHSTVDEQLAKLHIPTLVIGIQSDQLFPIAEQHRLFECLPNASFGIIHSPFGHDAFLIEHKQLSQLFNNFFKEIGHEHTGNTTAI